MYELLLWKWKWKCSCNQQANKISNEALRVKMSWGFFRLIKNLRFKIAEKLWILFVRSYPAEFVCVFSISTISLIKKTLTFLSRLVKVNVWINPWKINRNSNIEVWRWSASTNENSCNKNSDNSVSRHEWWTRISEASESGKFVNFYWNFLLIFLRSNSRRIQSADVARINVLVIDAWFERRQNPCTNGAFCVCYDVCPQILQISWESDVEPVSLINFVSSKTRHNSGNVSNDTTTSKRNWLNKISEDNLVHCFDEADADCD